MLKRLEQEKREESHLNPYGTRSDQSKGREHPEEECSFRTRFQRDRDRIIHSSAFRRLEYKTQVFVNHEGDYYRTRLTHSLEVAQIAKSIARALRVNEDLAETLALCHDLGHTPFGHAGEIVLNQLMEDYGGFEHNRQSYRVVTLLEERYPDFRGLNLTFETLEGIVKHSGDFDSPFPVTGFDKGYPSIEAQLANISDEIAYTNHDLDDGLKSEMISADDLKEIALWGRHYKEVQKKHPSAPDKIVKKQAIRSIIHRCILDVQDYTRHNIRDRDIRTAHDIAQKGGGIVAFSPALDQDFKSLKKFLFENLYHHNRVERMTRKAKMVIIDLFHAFRNDPKTLPKDVFDSFQKNHQLEQHIADYIASMTDRFALDEHKKLFDPHEKV